MAIFYQAFFTLGLLLLSSAPLQAQVSQNFEGSTPGTNAYVDGNSPTIVHELVNNPSPQTQPNALPMGNQLGYQATFTPTRTGGSGDDGLTDGDLFGVVDFTVPASADNSMGSLSINYVTDDPPPSGGSQIYTLEDSDGLVELRFSRVSLAGTSSPQFSMNYIVNSSSFENSDGADDRIKIYLDINDGASEIILLDVTNDAVPNTEEWLTLNQDLTAQIGNTVQLVIEFDTNAGTEEMGIDNIQFSQGEIDEGTMCTEADVPVLSQSPTSVCAGLPYRIELAGALNSATDWFIYSDAAGTNLVDSTTANEIVFFNAQPGITYFIRGEGGCTTPSELVPITVQITEASSCVPGQMPGTSFEEPLGLSVNYVDTGDPNIAHQLMNNAGQPTVDFPFTAAELGFQSFFFPTRSDGSAVGLTDGDPFGVSNDPSFSFPDGQQGFVMEDSDGLARVEFTSVNLNDVTDPTLSFQYFLNGSSYEASNGSVDSLRVYLRINQGTDPDIILLRGVADGSGTLPGLTTDAWTNFSTSAGVIPSGALVTLVLETDLDSGSEWIAFDDIVFSGGTVSDCLNDTEEPVISCPENIERDADPGFCDVAVAFAATATDNCTEDVDISYDATPNTFYLVGTTTVTATATDNNENSVNCSFTITVNDVEGPVINCPESFIRNRDAGGCSYTVVGQEIDPAVVGDCSLPISFENDYAVGTTTLEGVVFPVGATTITWTVLDANGTASECIINVSIIDPDSTCLSSTYELDQGGASFTVVPNPNNGQFQLQLDDWREAGRLTIYDLNGRRLRQQALPARATLHPVLVSDLAAGVYLIRITNGGQWSTRRLVIRK